jgi:hypothetical protein
VAELLVARDATNSGPDGLRVFWVSRDLV